MRKILSMTNERVTLKRTIYGNSWTDQHYKTSQYTQIIQDYIESTKYTFQPSQEEILENKKEAIRFGLMKIGFIEFLNLRIGIKTIVNKYEEKKEK